MGKGPTRRQGPGKASDTVRAIKRGARNADPHTGTVRGGYHKNPAVYDRKDDDTQDRLDEHQSDASLLEHLGEVAVDAATQAARATGDPLLKIQLLQRALEEAHEEIKRLGNDCVSGLAVRATFEKHIEGVFNQRRCTEHPLGVLMIDIDHFKQVNDNHGHRVGDEMIFQVARCVREATRTTDLVARYGGEEFVVVVAAAKLAGLTILAERIRASIEAMDIEGLPRVTVSIGFTTQHSNDTSGWDLVERADKNLYRAKETGRNKVCHETLEGPEMQLILKIEETRKGD
jgi:diguanylate cyclase (GGDEF)-like protein